MNNHQSRATKVVEISEGLHGVEKASKSAPRALFLKLRGLEKPALGFAVVLVIQALASSKHYVLAGLAPLFPTFALLAHWRMYKNGRSNQQIVHSILIGIATTPVYLVYLTGVVIGVPCFGPLLGLLSAVVLWLLAAMIVVIVNNYCAEKRSSTKESIAAKKQKERGFKLLALTSSVLVLTVLLTVVVSGPQGLLESKLSLWLLRPLIGSVLVLLLDAVSQSERLYFLAGMLPLFPTFGLLAHITLAIERADDLLESAVFSAFSLIPYLSYLVVAWLFLRYSKRSFFVAISYALTLWSTVAFRLYMLWPKMWMLIRPSFVRLVRMMQCHVS